MSPFLLSFSSDSRLLGSISFTPWRRIPRRYRILQCNKGKETLDSHGIYYVLRWSLQAILRTSNVLFLSTNLKPICLTSSPYNGESKEPLKLFEQARIEADGTEISNFYEKNISKPKLKVDPEMVTSHFRCRLLIKKPFLSNGRFPTLISASGSISIFGIAPTLYCVTFSL